MLAVATMDPAIRALFFFAALVLFALAAASVAAGRVRLEAVGLACFVFPFFWDALAAV